MHEPYVEARVQPQRSYDVGHGFLKAAMVPEINTRRFNPIDESLTIIGNKNTNDYR